MSSGGWNDAQRAAIGLGGQLLVSASAGTGKTAVLVERIIRHILDADSPGSLDRLMVVTFNDAAATQMRARILAALLERRAADPGNARLDEQIAILPRAHISTLHAWCLRLVRQHFHTLGIDPAVTPMDEHEADLLLRETLADLCEARYAGNDQGWLSLVDAYGNDRGDEPVRGLALELLKFARTQPDPRQWLLGQLVALRAAAAGGLAGSAWATELRCLVATRLSLAANELRYAILLCKVPGGPEGYCDVLAADVAQLAELADMGRAGAPAPGGWDRLLAELAGLEKQGRLRTPPGAPEALRKKAQGCRTKAWEMVASLQQAALGWSTERLLADLAAAAPLVAALVALVVDLDDDARNRRTQRGLIDFADFEYYALRLLAAPGPRGGYAGDEAAPSELAVTLRERYAQVLVDEYQDINPAQDQILRLVSHGNLFCVGDIKQSIYRFRGTDPGAFRRLREAYAPVCTVAPACGDGGSAASVPDASGPHPGRLVDLSANYRSRPVILSAVNFLCRQLMLEELAEVPYDAAAELLPGASGLYAGAPDRDAAVELYVLERPRGAARRSSREGGDAADQDSADDDAAQGPEVEQVLSEPDDQELTNIEREAAFVGQRILEMVRPGDAAEFSVYDTRERAHRPVRFKDIAVLMRAVQGRANRYVEAFTRLGIPVRAELSTGYFTAIEVQTILALLRVIDNPRQDIDLAAVLRSPLVGLDEEGLAGVRAHLPRGPFHDAVGAAAQGNSESAAALREFLERLEVWRTAARRGPLGDLLWRLLQDTGYLAFVGGLPDGLQRQANLLALHDRARQFDGFARQGLSRFLAFIERIHEAGREVGSTTAPGADLDAVLLTTVHKAKGLEFPVVFLPDLGKGFHRSKSRDALWHSQLGFGAKVADRAAGIKYPTAAWQAIDRRITAEGLAEEMRVLYVALTRARERLVLSGSTLDPVAALGRWQATAGGQRVPPEILATRQSYLEWVGTAMVRHAQACQALEAGIEAITPVDAARDTLADAASTGGGSPPDWLDPSQWYVRVLSAADAEAPSLAGQVFPAASQRAATPRTATELSDLFARVQRLAPVGGVSEVELAELDERMGWRYPWSARTTLPAKVSVSEVRRRHAELLPADADPDVLAPGVGVAQLAGADDAGAGAAASRDSFAGDGAFKLPLLRAWGEPRTMGGMERGTLAHLLIRHVDLAGQLDADGLKSQVDVLVGRRILPAEAKQLPGSVLAGLAWFFATPFGRELLADRHQVRREQAFTMALPAAEIWPGATSPNASLCLEDEFVLVQGIIDCLVVRPGGIHIVEFKTDQLPVASAADTALRRYRRQVELYSQAAAQALGLPVSQAALVLLVPQVLVEVDILAASTK